MHAIIPARAGSKRLPNKNIKTLNGKPLIVHTIEAALEAELVDKVVVSTDSEEIAQISLTAGAEVPFMRPASLSTDEAKSSDVIEYTISKLEEIDGQTIQSVVLLQPTSPLRTPKHIDEAIDLFYKKKADSVISYCKEHHPMFWHKFIDSEGRFEDVFSIKKIQEMSHDKRISYFPNGALYIINKELIKSGNYYSKNSYAYLMDRSSSVDIDTADDFKMAEFFLSFKD